MMRDATQGSDRVRLRLERHQRAREEGEPTISVLVGPVSAGRQHWEQWHISRGREFVDVTSGESEIPLTSRIAHSILHGRSILHDVAQFVGRYTAEPLATLSARLRIAGPAERRQLFKDVRAGSRRPQVVRLAESLLAGSEPSMPRFDDEDSIVALLGLLAPLERPGVLVATETLEPVVSLLVAITTRLPDVAVAVAVLPEGVERFFTSPAPTRAHALLRAGLVPLPVSEPPSASIEGVERIASQIEQLAAYTQHAPVGPVESERARSLAERLLFDALEQHPATRGCFELNGQMPFRFGPRAAEIDIVSRRARIAIEIDGYYHFVDADAYRRDRRKDALMQRHGLFVLRFLAQDVAALLPQIVAEIVDTVHLHSSSSPGPLA